MKFDHKKFFDLYKAEYGPLTQQKVDGLESLLNSIENDPDITDVRWAAYLDAKRFATVSEAGKLVIWQEQPLKPLATMQIQSGCTPALSPVSW